jgi:polysaccharide export outer membrane protein
MNNKLIIASLAFTVAVALSPLVAQQVASASVKAVAAPSSSSYAPAPDYVLQPGDTIAVRILNEASLNDQMKAIKISQDYSVSLPVLEKPVSLSNMTMRQVENLIHDLYSPDYIKNPSVTVTIVEVVRRTVNVHGEVKAPSLVPIPTDRPLTLIDAITLCGGFTNLARSNKVKLTRTFSNGQKETHEINADDLNKGGQSKDDWVLSLQPNDEIFVPQIII